MAEKEYVKNDLTSMDPRTGDISLKVAFEGESKIPFWNDDLKVKVILSLLDSIDIKHYAESNLHEDPQKDADKIIEATQVAFGRNY